MVFFEKFKFFILLPFAPEPILTKNSPNQNLLLFFSVFALIFLNS